MLSSQPLKRSTIFLGEYAGVALALSLAFLFGVGLPVAMLHFELFGGTASGPLTVMSASGGFQRRADLIDPSGFLDACLEHTIAH